jgi:hypothetical protein
VSLRDSLELLSSQIPYLRGDAFDQPTLESGTALR